MADLIPPAPIDAPFASYNWNDWYQKVRNGINNATDLRWSNFTSFTGSNLTQLETRLHNSLQAIQGGAPGDYYHLTAAQHAAATATGLTTVVITAKLTTGGVNGSMTFTNGRLTAHTPAT